MDLVKIAEWIVLGLAVIMALFGFAWVRGQIRNRGNVTYATIISNFGYLVAVVVVWFGNYSPFHLLWLFPASFIIGFLTLLPAFSAVLVPLAKLYGTVACIGLDEEEIARNRARVERVHDLIAAGMNKDEAIRLVRAEDDEQGQ